MVEQRPQTMGTLTMFVMLLTAVALIEAKRAPLGQSIILITVDGYGAALLNTTKADAEHGIHKIAAMGVRADHLKPVFPTLTIPSWHSLATGLYTENHGMTANYMYDAATNKTYFGGRNITDSDYFWWKNRPKPFWYTAGKNNVDVSCYWFSYCQQPFGDLAVLLPEERKTDLLNPDQTNGMPAMFDEMVTRIARYQPYRKQIFLIRYTGIDTALRHFGAGSDQVEQALAKFDDHLTDLQEKMEENGLHETTNLIVLSDHGLARVVEEEQFYLEECLSDYSNIVKVIGGKSMLIIHTKEGHEDAVFFELKVCDQWENSGDYEDEVSPVEVYRSNDLPEHLHLGHGRFLGNIVVITKPGTTVITRQLPSVPARETEREREFMGDGWNNTAESMLGIFVARGPAFKVGERADPVELVDIYNMMLNIVGIPAAHTNNGSWERVEPMLHEDWENRASSPITSSSSSISFFSLFVMTFIARLF
ncbi:hypothetical protein PFISCL1PPCAC_27118 [Pristionchus fissidentatus]|uniref:Uncharacterized protein n=1 Tax=Pristionchus fissidentatus TaxID=1538716 RepID=A0AAV5WU55_9BILA|nr:hypothetical protein PFISCL1PPCAC_27118 [Pristionchus fissidentatus]